MSEAIFCKFRNVDRNLIDSLVRGYVYFASPEQLNDPFDCQINIAKSLSSAIDKSTGKSKQKLKRLKSAQAQFDALNKKLSNSGIFSCSHNMHSKSLRQPLLWTHYADSHKGVCLVYNIPEEYVLSEPMAAVPVIYKSNPLIGFFIKWAKSSKKMSNHEFIDELAKMYLSIKDKWWSYEDEYRLIRENPGEFQLDRSYLKFVCYGLNTPQKDRKLIDSLLSNGGYEVEFYEIERTSNDFGIKEKKI